MTGGAKDFHPLPELLAEFKRGLMKAVKSTNAWVITGGTSTVSFICQNLNLYNFLMSMSVKRGVLQCKIACSKQKRKKADILDSHSNRCAPHID